MCIKGGKRCKINVEKVNAHRRDRYAVRTSEKIINEVIQEHGQDFTGDVQGIGLSLNSPLLAKSYAIAVRAHAGVRRTTGEVYLNHPLRVAYTLQKAGFNHEAVSVALLHDSVEDSELTLGKLRQLGFNERIVSGVDSVTKRDGEHYDDAMVRVSSHPLGRLVKLCDNKDNSSEKQLAPFSKEKKEQKIAKYTPARLFIVKGIMETPAEQLMTYEQGFHAGYKISHGDNADILDILK